MTDTPKPAIGTCGWIDLTVDDAEGVRDFYAAVVGWRPEPVPMGSGDDAYADFNMVDAAGEPAAGVCHRRGPNTDIPSGWIVYFRVADVDASVAACRERGGEVLREPAPSGMRIAIVRDPSGACCALVQSD